MEKRFSELKTEFNNIVTIRNNVKSIFDILQTRINKLKLFYSEFIKNNKNQLFIFGLDSFHFQSKLIDIEYDDVKRLFLAINNRMYCEYFKLYKIIVEYINQNITDKKITEMVKVNNFPIYKDLEPFKEYKFEVISEVHENILILLNTITSNLNTKENELSVHKSKKDIGLNIDNFINSFNYEIIMMREKVALFLTYIDFFHQLHIKYLKRFSNKIQLMYAHINNDIKFDESVELDHNKKKEIIDDYKNTGELDKETLKELRHTINSDNDDDDSSEDSDENKIISPLSSNRDKSESIDTSTNSNNSNNSKDIRVSLIKLNNLTTTNDEPFENKEISIKKSGKQLLKNGVNAVKSMLSICGKSSNNLILGSPINNVIDPSITHEDICSHFMNIEESCDTILKTRSNDGSNDGISESSSHGSSRSNNDNDNDNDDKNNTLNLAVEEISIIEVANQSNEIINNTIVAVSESEEPQNYSKEFEDRNVKLLIEPDNEEIIESITNHSIESFENSLFEPIEESVLSIDTKLTSEVESVSDNTEKKKDKKHKTKK